MTVQMLRPVRHGHRWIPQGEDQGIALDRRPVCKFGRQGGAIGCARNARCVAKYADQTHMRRRFALGAQQQILQVVAVQGARQEFTLGRGSYTEGKWIDISYGRPLKRGRDLWGAGPTYGQDLLVDAPIWRAGANVTTQLTSDVPLIISGHRLAPGKKYTVFVDVKEGHWTFVLSTLTAQTHKKTLRQKEGQELIFIYEPRMGDVEEIEIDETGKIACVVDNTGNRIALKNFIAG